VQKPWAGRAAAMAVCVQAENYSEFPSPLGDYGASAPYPGPQPSEVGSEVQAAPQSPWNQCQAEPVQFWEGENGGDQSPNVGGGEWQGGMAPMSYSGGWVNGGSAQPPPQAINGQGGSGQHQQRQKRRFCTSFPEVQLCRRGTGCSFAHSREEIRAPLLEIEEERQDPEAMTDDFFMYKYKTLWCPIGVQHEWHTCVYAHNYQDARRPVSLGYGARLCPYWSKKDTGSEYSQRCPLGLRCPYAHGAKEQLYHPDYFKTVICRDLKVKACPRHGLCAFFHHRTERRPCHTNDDIDYSQPLIEEVIDNEWMTEFLAPPFLPEMSKGNEDGIPSMNNANCNFSNNGNGDWMKYGGPQAPQAPYGMGMQQPMVFLLPYAPMSTEQSPQMGCQMQMVSPMGDQMGHQMGHQMQMMSPMSYQMGNQMGGQMVFVPMETQQLVDA